MHKHNEVNHLGFRSIRNLASVNHSCLYSLYVVQQKLSRESPILAALNNMDREKRILLHENATLHEELCKARTEVSLTCLTFSFVSLFITSDELINVFGNPESKAHFTRKGFRVGVGPE